MSFSVNPEPIAALWEGEYDGHGRGLVEHEHVRLLSNLSARWELCVAHAGIAPAMRRTFGLPIESTRTSGSGLCAQTGSGL